MMLLNRCIGVIDHLSHSSGCFAYELKYKLILSISIYNRELQCFRIFFFLLLLYLIYDITFRICIEYVFSGKI